MQKRFLNILAIGGVALLCAVPRVASAQDGAVRTLNGPHGLIITNVNLIVAEATIPTVSTAVPEPKSLTVLQPTGSQMPSQYRDLVDAISKNNGVDPDLIDAMMKTESNYVRWAVSSKGAKGLMQLMPETGRRFGVQDFFDPRQNIEGGVRYMKFLLDMFDGNINLSLAAYNAGENAVAKLGAIPPIPETRSYVQKIRAIYKKPLTAAVSTTAASEPAKQTAAVLPPAKVYTSEPQASANSPSKGQESNTPISKWVDERGVTHYSNIGPPN